jgi:hypothetical protein
MANSYRLAGTPDIKGGVHTMRSRRILGFACSVLFAGLFLTGAALAQTDTATISGLVTDSSGGVIPDAEVQLQNAERGTVTTATTNGAGIYVFAAAQPGQYQITVRKAGFKQVDLLGVIVNVQDHLEQNFRLQVGSLSESVTVTAATATIDSESAAVSTVIDRDFVENIPLNGRSLQTLLMLTPGVVFAYSGSTGAQGQFSVNGQRTDANYVTVDGVAANLGTDGVGNGLPEAAAGSAVGYNVLGGTNSLVSVDAVQEFRVQTSSFAPEYGRTPGGQVSVVSRSGENAWHGTAFEYLRNDIFDANDWFANNAGLPKAEERQNDFGGVLGGPIIKNKSFFFFSYEGLRLRQPITFQTSVPDSTARNTAPPVLQPFLKAYPIANGPELTDNLAQLNVNVSNPASLDAYSIRLDQHIGSNLNLFVRYAYSPSSIASATLPNNFGAYSITTQTFTVGADYLFSNSISNQIRVNYSNLKSSGNNELTTAGGGTLPPVAGLYPPGVDPTTAHFSFDIFDSSGYSSGPVGVNEQRQFNLVDNLSLTKGLHHLQFGLDFRYLAPFQGTSPYYQQVYFDTVGPQNVPGSVLSGQTDEIDVTSVLGVSVRTRNLSLYAEDSWKVKPQLTITYGLRWDVNPPPKGASRSNDPLVVQGLSNPATLSLAPPGTPFYATTYGNFAPRLGIAYQFRQAAGWEAVVRGGVGTFYDIGSGSLGSYALADPFRPSNFFAGATFPLTPSQAVPPVFIPGTPLELFVAEPNLVLPRTYQWNVAIEQSLGPHQTLSITYLGSLGRNMLRNYGLYEPNPNFYFLNITTNEGSSNYQALQVQFNRRVSHGLSATASYTYSHSIDNASDDYSAYTPSVIGNPNIDRGNSAFDVRHAASGALTYDLPAPSESRVAHAILGGWSVINLFIARTAFPVDLAPDMFFVGPYPYNARPNVNPGVPFYLYGSQYPGGKAFNAAAFSDAASGTEGDLGRNTLRGFGMWQDNFAIHRQFNLTERLNLQFRFEAFNVFNHPNFGDPYGGYPLNSPLFGVSTLSLANSLSSFGGQGQSSIYQIGGPRSLQFGLRLAF